jgi:predicted NBD/HSP70 family sugar kinase
LTLRLGVDLGGTKIEAVVMNDDDMVVERIRVDTPREDYAGTLAMIARLVEQLEADMRVDSGSLPVGLGTPGAWMPRTGKMKNCNSTWLNDQPLLTDVIALLGDRVRIANDADCFALSEARLLEAGTAHTVFGVILGTGVGGGLVVGGSLLKGPNALTGEWGHTPLPYLRDDTLMSARLRELETGLNDRVCYCGRDNCIEAFISGPGLARTHKELCGEQVDARTLCSRSDAAAEASLTLYAHMLCRGLSQIVNIVDPDVIILGGGMSNVGRLYDLVDQHLSAYVFAGDCVTPIRPPQGGDSSGVMGAAQLWS